MDSDRLKDQLRPPLHFLKNSRLRAQVYTRWLKQRFRRDASASRVPLKDIALKTRDWVRGASGRRDTDWYREPPLFIPIPDDPPRTLEPVAFSTADFNRVPPLYVAQIKHVHAFGDEGDLVTADGTLLADVSAQRPHLFFGEIQQHRILRGEAFDAPRKLAGTGCQLTSMWAGVNYFHWMFNLLPRVELLRRCGVNLDSVDWFLCNPIRFPYQRETLARVGIGLDRLVIAEPQSWFQCERLIVPCGLLPSGHKSRWVADWMRELILPRGVPAVAGRRRLFVSRADARYRYMTNEAECFRLLEPLGFECVLLNDLPLVEQATLFAQAEAIIAPHGAALSNLIYCQPGTRVMEMLIAGKDRSDYFPMAQSLGLEYFYMFGKVVPTGGEHADFSVDLAQFQEMVRTMGL